ncbi:MAG: GUN4 domain-containing protein [Coleofasciculaceae cyanobacterium]
MSQSLRNIIAALGVIVSLAAFVQPEIRQCLGLDPGGCPLERFNLSQANPDTPNSSQTDIINSSTGINPQSEVGEDYSKLQNLLVSSQFKQANQETKKLMLQLANRSEQGWLNDSSIEQFSCEDLHTINQLWLQYSNGKFGFSVQKQIFQAAGKDQDKFADSVGWSNLSLNLQTPKGFFPRADVCWPGKVNCWFSSPRLDACGI